MSSKIGAKDGGKAVADELVAQSRALVDRAAAEERQFDYMDPLTPEEMADAQDRLGPGAGNLAVLKEARAERKRGRPPGARNRRNEDFRKLILSYGPHPAVTMAQIQATPPEVLVERSRQIDPIKRRMSYADAQALRTRCAEALLPYLESKKPVAIDLDVSGDFNLLVPNVNISEADAQRAASGQFVLDADYEDIDEVAGDG